ncbi:RagB/SusD family nutrient uptake outer membrane protein [Phocaeicola sp.]
MIKKYIFAFVLASFSLSSCLDLDVAPMNIVQDKDIFTSENGVLSYMARIYSQLPVEDFRYSGARGFNHFWIIDPVPMLTGEAIGRDWCGAHSEDFDYYADDKEPSGNGYKLIRDINYFLETLPSYESYFSTEQVNTWKGEALFARGFAYFALAKRYGGVPLVNTVLKYPEQSIDDLKVPRSSEEAVYNQVYQDLTDAFNLLPEKAQRGRATRYAAAALNSRAMLFAGSIAKFNKNSNLVDKDGNRLVGIDASKARDFYQKSYDEAKKVEGHHSLYMKNWKEGDKEAQYQNFVNAFFDESSEENIFVKEYAYPNSVHGYDAYCVPRQAMGANGYATLVNPTLDFVEMFDGLPKDANGHLQNFDEKGHYKMFDKTMDLFANAEPRLRASVILPGDDFKGESISIYRGIYTKADAANGISHIIPDDATEKYENISECKDYIVSSPNPDNQTVYTLPDGTKMNAAGLSGPFASDTGAGAMSGFSVRKWLNPDMPKSAVLENNSTQTWIEIRYAEVLLNRAEAAYELAELGAGANYKEDAYQCINQIRHRAGADLLASSAELNDFSIIQRERRKELAFENKTWWDLKRWRVIEKEQQSTLWRILMPFYAAHAGKYFFDVRTDEDNSHRFTFDTRWYYKNFPNSSIEKNPLLLQNPGY